jgi:hypothetical protein
MLSAKVLHITIDWSPKVSLVVSFSFVDRRRFSQWALLVDIPEKALSVYLVSSSVSDCPSIYYHPESRKPLIPELPLCFPKPVIS